MTDTSRLFLTGFSGTGKSVVAPLVADALGWRVLDTDKMIEEASGHSIPHLFENEGEAHFRHLEHETLHDAAREERAVIATGGGAVLSEQNRRAMAGAGLVVCLEARPPAIVERLHGMTPVSERPLLWGGDPLERVTELKSRRQKFYALADVIIETDGKTPQQVADAVIEALRAPDPWPAAHRDRLLLPEERDPAPPSDDPVWVEAPSRRYPVYTGWGALDDLGERLREVGLQDAAWIVSDSEVLPRHGDRAIFSLREAGFAAGAFAIPAGEASKTLDVAATVYDWLVSQRAERGHTIVALGGGVVGDLAGFVAATYLRGLPFVQAPTSVLSMVDASIGGKVAVDHRAGKNLIGMFYQPWLVVEDVSLLKTLPRRALVEGWAEAIKHALIRDPRLLDDMDARADDLLHLEPAVTVDIVRRNVAIKAAVVAEDERDTGLRAILNYGHTVGHAIEAAGGYAQVFHGAADAIGMTAAAEIGRRMGVTPAAVVERQRAVLERFGLSTRAPKGIDAQRVLDAIALDKKVAQGSVRWVLLEEIGRPVLRSDVPADLVREVVREILS